MEANLPGTKKSELIRELAADIARNGDGPIVILWEKGKRNKEMRCPIAGSVQRRVTHGIGAFSVIQVFDIETRSVPIED